MNLLLTGASGFVGSNLLSVLKENENYKDITCFALTSKKIENFTCINHKNYSYIKEELINNGLKHVDVVIHLGAFTPKNTSGADDLQGSFANIRNTLHLIENLPNIPSKFILISSTSVYPEGDSVIDENTKEAPESMYGYSKLYCEKMVEKYCRREGIKYQILRVGPIYGKGEEAYNRLIPITLRQLAENKLPYIVNDGNTLRSFIHVRDVCNIILKTLKLETYIGPINVVSNQEYKIIELIELCITISNRKVKPTIIYRDLVDKDQRFNNEKMRKWLDHEYIDIAKGLYEEYNHILSSK